MSQASVKCHILTIEKIMLWESQTIKKIKQKKTNEW